MTERSRRDDWMSQDDAALLADCGVDTYRASGPGGQHRNKTSSAVRLRHRPSGLLVIAEESRSQHENKVRALRRLRMAFSLRFRESVDEQWEPPAVFRQHLTKTRRIEISRRNPAYPAVVATVLDAIAARHGRVREAGSLLGLSTAQLSRFVAADHKVLDVVNRIRHSAGLRSLSSKR